MRNRLEQYLSYVASRNAIGTAKRVRCILSAFTVWLQERGVSQWYELTPEHVRCWAAQRSREVQPSTLFDYKREVRALLLWLYRGEYLLVNPWDETLDGHRPPYNPRRTPTEEQARTLLRRAGERGLCAARNRAILELAYGSGLRRKEMQGLNLADMREEWLRVRGKGDRERVVPLGAVARKWLLRYIAVERSHAAGFGRPGEPALFLTWYGTRLGVDAYGYIFRMADKQRISTLHGMRHACATHMLRNGADVRTLQKLLGHRKLTSTQVYTSVDRSDLAKLLVGYHPRG